MLLLLESERVMAWTGFRCHNGFTSVRISISIIIIKKRGKEKLEIKKFWKRTNLKVPIFPNVSCPPSLSANKAARASFSSSFFLTARVLCPCWILGVWETGGGAGEDDNEDRWEGECVSYVLWRLKEGEGLRCCSVWLDGGIEGDDEGAKGLFVLSSKIIIIKKQEMNEE